MILECKDLERALRTRELLPDMRVHAEHCTACREQLYLWNEISRVAPQLHEEWDSPYLWQRIRAEAESETARARPPVWRWGVAAMALAAVAVVLLYPWNARPSAGPELLTDSAFAEVQQAETAYVRSIEKLSALAARDLDRSPSPLAAAYREKLLVLDSAIAELRADADRNRYNTYLRTELASLYRQKQDTLREWLQNANRN